MAGCNSGPSIWIADSYYPGAANNNSGLINMRHGVIVDGGIVMGTAGAPAATGYHYWFDEVHYESVSESFLRFDNALDNRSDIWLHRIGYADPITSDNLALIDNNAGATLNGLRVNNCNFMYIKNAPLLGKPPVGTVQVDGFKPVLYNGLYNLYGSLPLKRQFSLDGETELCSAFRGGDMAPQMLPADALNLAINQDVSAWSGSNVTVTGGQAAPDGSATAYRLTSTGGIEKTLYIGNKSTLTDYWFIVGMWVRAYNQANRIQRAQNTPVIRVYFGGASSPVFNDDVGDTTLNRDITSVHANSSQAGWLFLSEAFSFAATGGPTDLRLILMVGANSGDFLAWKPFLIALPRASYGRRDVARLLSNLSLLDGGVRPGVLGQMAHQTFRTGAGATGLRPSASAVGAGAQWFDTTLNKPIWSDGTRWRDAVGNFA
jgi:hypothetical protein